MSKRDEIAKYLFGLYNRTLEDWSDDPNRIPPMDRAIYRDQANTILALLADPDDRMVEAARKALIEAWRIGGGSLPEGSGVIKAAIRAAMQAAGE